MAPQQIREIKIKIDAGDGDAELRKIADGMGRLNKSLGQGVSVLTKFERAYQGLLGLSFAGIGIGTIVSAVDSMQKLSDKLNLTEGSAEKAQQTLAKFAEVAQMTKSSVEDVSVVYTRLFQATSDLNIGTDAVLGMTIALQNSFRLYGATASEAKGATIQLSQALASGQLRGQELRSVLEANGLMGEILAKKLGIARGELLKWSEENGGIKTSVVMGALADNFDRINTMAEKLTPTIGESLTIAFDKVKLKIGELNRQTGFSKVISDGIIGLADNVGVLVKGVGILIGAWALYKTSVLTVAGVQLATNVALQATNASALIGVFGLKAYALGLMEIATASKVAQAAMGPLGLAMLGISAITTALVVNNSNLEQTALLDAGAHLEQNGRYWNKRGEELIKNADGTWQVLKATQNWNFEIPKVVQNLAEQSGWMQKGASSAGVYKTALQEATEKTKNMKGAFNFEESLARLNNQFKKNQISLSSYNEEVKKLQIQELDERFEKGKLTLEKYNKELNEIKFGKAQSSLKQFRGELGALNQEFEYEFKAGNIRGYAEALDHVKWEKLNRDLKEGKINFFDYNKQYRDLSIVQYNRELSDGAISMNQWIAGTQKLQLAELNAQWKAGTLDVREYHKQITETQEMFNPGSAFFTGTQNYIQQAGTLSQNVSNMITNTFGNLENTFMDFIKTGKLSFKGLADAVLEDLQRIIIRQMIVRNLAMAIGGMWGGGGGESMESQNGLGASNGALAKRGAYFDGKTSYFAKGGIVDGATPFSYGGGGKRGVMGEAGPEAIMPLRRTASGDLGVQASTAPVVVNIHNNTDGQVEQRESRGPNGEKVLDIMISQKIKEAFANGTMDKQMSSNYGLRRKGI